MQLCRDTTLCPWAVFPQHLEGTPNADIFQGLSEIPKEIPFRSFYNLTATMAAIRLQASPRL